MPGRYTWWTLQSRSTSSRRLRRMLGRQDPQMDLADAVLWTGKIEPKPLAEKGAFHDQFAAGRATILRDEDFEHWFDAEGRAGEPGRRGGGGGGRSGRGWWRERSCWRWRRGAATGRRSSGCATT